MIKLFREELGYRFLGSRAHRSDNSNIEERLLTDYLRSSGYGAAYISGALRALYIEADNPIAVSTAITRKSTACSGTACRSKRRPTGTP